MNGPLVDTSQLTFLAGGGEMGARMRELHWSSTPLGSPEAWPQSLRSTVSMLLPSKAQIVVFWGPEFVTLYNDAYRPVFGTKHPNALGRPGREAWREIWDTQLRALLEGVVRTGEAFWARDLLFVLERHGFVEDTYFDVSYDPVRVESGTVGGVFCIVTETTERVVGQRRLGLLRDLAARNSMARTEREACVSAIQSLENQTDIAFALAYLDNELQASTTDGSTMLELARPELVATLPLSLSSAGRSGRLIVGVNPRRPFDDSYRSFLELVADQLSSGLTNARAYEAERQRAEALTALDRAKTTFFSNVSHEFRTPLTLLVGPLEDELTDADAAPEVHRVRIETAHRNALRLLRLVNSLLDFSRIEAGRIDASYEPTDLAALTAGLASAFRSAIERAGLSLSVDTPPLPGPVYVDRDMWEKIVLNLLSNALKFTLEGEIRVQLNAQGDLVELRVADTGIGISEAELARVFERFHRVRHARARTQEGTGIGLALVQELARLHGGTVSVASEEGRGSTFTVSIRAGTAHLPAERISSTRQLVSTSLGASPFVEEALRWLPDSQRPAALHEVTFARSEVNAGNGSVVAERLLIADDNADMRDYLASILGQHYRVEVVADGAAALASVRSSPPDLVLSDVMMPTLDGFGLLAALRGDANTLSVPMVLLSARAGEEARIEGLRAGANEYLVKPFSARELLAVVASQLELARVRRDSERTLRHQVEQHLTLINRAPLGVYLLDADFRFAEVNPIAAPVFSGFPGGVIGHRFEEVTRSMWPETYANEMIAIFQHTLQTGESYISTDGGEPRIDRDAPEYYEWRADRITLPDGRFGLVCYFRDVSERRQAAAAKAYLAAIVDSADDAILAKDLNGVIQSCNAAAERLFGYSAAELVGRSVRMLIPPERQLEEDEILARLRRGERLQHFETVRVAKDGRHIDVALTISPVRDEHGKIIGASKIGRDITGVKQAEAERIRLLQENAAVTETLNNVGALVASDLERSKVVQAVTDAATELTGAEFGAFFYNELDERGETYTLYTISGVPREAFSKFPMPRNTAVFEPTFKGTGVVRSDDITKESTYGHNAPHHGMPPGHLPVHSYLAVPVKGRGGDVIGGLFFGHSQVARFAEHHERIAVGIAAWAAVALENSHLYESVQDASRLKDEFLASLSHELRTPLNAIVGYVRMLQAGMLPPEKRQKAIDTIARNATSLTQIVEDVLDISRIVSGKIRLNVQPVDLPAVVRNAIDAIAPAAEAKRVRVETVLDPHAGPISGDPERLQQVLWNLLSNAVKFTKRDGKVQVRLERVNSHLEVIVSDTGIGIAPEFLPHVFERFRQAEGGTTRERGGLGLGLSIARQLAEMHGGTIDVSSPGLGQGATFCVTLPLMSVQPIREEGARVHPRSPSNPEKVADAPLHGIHVLAVDDEPDALALIGTVLESAGARVTAAPSAEDALNQLLPDMPDVVITDLGMPKMDGFALIEQLRHHASAKVREVPAAALTAYARSEDRVRALRAGFQIHLAKPIDPAELITTIASLAKRVVVKDPERSSDPS
ncbi:MAG TPA: ATP-binding protein [Polyangiaceae bacterium]|nr:ATP-binding protein [Polyangiaceae bacterium]